MSVENKLLSQDTRIGSERVTKALSHLEAARTLRRNRRFVGSSEHMDLYYKDLDGDWLEKWAEEESEES